jgi:hypothetical protein
MSADTKGSYNDPRFSDTRIGKQFDFFPHHFLCANIAGSVRVCESVVSELVTQIDKLVGAPRVFHDHIRNAVKEAQINELLYRLDYEMVNHLAMRLAEWKTLDKASLQFRRAARLVRKFQLQMQLTVGGFVGGSILLLETNFNDAPEMVEYSAIGSGGDLAAESLIKRDQGANTSFQRTVVHVAEAMEAARSDQYVGEPADYVIITPRSYRRLPARDPYLLQLLLKYLDKDTEELDDTDEATNRLRDAMYFPGITREEYARGMRRPTGAGLPIGRKLKERTEGHWMITQWNDDKNTFSLPRLFTEPIQTAYDNASLNNHVYLAADCKTLGCNVQLVIQHRGLYDPQSTYGPPRVGVLRLPCNVCSAANDYSQHDLKFIRGPKPTKDFKGVF